MIPFTESNQISKLILRSLLSLYVRPTRHATPFRAHASCFYFMGPCVVLLLYRPTRHTAPLRAHASSYPFTGPRVVLLLYRLTCYATPLRAQASCYSFSGPRVMLLLYGPTCHGTLFISSVFLISLNYQQEPEPFWSEWIAWANFMRKSCGTNLFKII